MQVWQRRGTQASAVKWQYDIKRKRHCDHKSIAECKCDRRRRRMQVWQRRGTQASAVRKGSGSILWTQMTGWQKNCTTHFLCRSHHFKIKDHIIKHLQVFAKHQLIRFQKIPAVHFIPRRGGHTEILKRAMMCRVIKSFSICCRLCFFNKENRKCFRDKMMYAKQVMNSEPYHTAFWSVRLSDLEWKLNILT